MKLKGINLSFTLLTVAAVLAGLFIFWQSSIRAAFKEDQIVSEYHVDTVKNAISQMASRYGQIIKVLSGHGQMAMALLDASDQNVDSANEILDLFNASLETSVCYLLDRNGIAIAASNRNDPDSFVGKSYEFRPYFNRAMEGAPFVYPALGVTSGKRGIYFSHPVSSPKTRQILGVIVIKEDIEKLEIGLLGIHFPRHIEHPDLVAITNELGVIFICDCKEPKLTTMWKITDEEMRQIKDSRQFGNGPWPWAGFTRTGRNTAIDRNGRRYALLIRNIVEIPGWKVLHFSDQGVISEQISDSLSKTALIVFLLVTVVVGSVLLSLNVLAHRSEKALRESEQRFRELYNNMGSGVAIYESPDNGQSFVFKDMNRSALLHTKAEKEMVVGREVRDVFPGVVDLGLFDVFRRVWKTGEPARHPSSIYKDDRLTMWVDNYVCKLPSGELVAIYEDTTARRWAEEDRERLRHQVQQAQKMESIGNLAGGIAHDFNNILFPIMGLTELLLEDVSAGTTEHENLVEILKAGKRGRDLVQQILAFSRQSEHRMMPVRIQQILRDVLKLMRSTIPSNIEISTDIQKNCGLVSADPTQLHQIVMNLTTNAYHALEKVGGNISILLKEKELTDGGPGQDDLPLGRYACLSISDTGAGMSPAVKEKIFEPYFTTKEKGKGTGLGLAVVYGIVKEHGGDITVESELGRGATFTVCLPLLEKEEALPAEETEAFHQGGTERILLVDDEKSIVRMVRQMLERLGYRVTVRSGSVDALAAFKSEPTGFDLVVSDMTMPNMTGDQLAGKLLAIRPDIPIIICTGFSERIDYETAMKIGIKGILMKPIVKSELARMIREVLDADGG